MILVSILLVLVAAGLLVGGLIQGADQLYIASMAASAFAALVLLLGVRSSGGRFARRVHLGITPGVPAAALLGQAPRNPGAARPIGRAAVPRPLGGGEDPAGGGTPAAAEARPDVQVQ